jgi:hypothetical protein
VGKGWAVLIVSKKNEKKVFSRKTEKGKMLIINCLGVLLRGYFKKNIFQTAKSHRLSNAHGLKKRFG